MCVCVCVCVCVSIAGFHSPSPCSEAYVYTYFKENEKIKEYIYKCSGISGNGQRNYALTKITNENTLLYYLDDDNIIHPDLYNLLNYIDNNTIYSFNQNNRI